MGLFKKFRRRLKRQVQKVSRKVETAVKQAAPILALIPGPVGAAAKAFSFARQLAGKNGFEPPVAQLPLVGRIAQANFAPTSAAVGPSQLALLAPPGPRLPTRSRFTAVARSRAVVRPAFARAVARPSFAGPSPVSTLAAFGLRLRG